MDVFNNIIEFWQSGDISSLGPMAAKYLLLTSGLFSLLLILLILFALLSLFISPLFPLSRIRRKLFITFLQIILAKIYDQLNKKDKGKYSQNRTYPAIVAETIVNGKKRISIIGNNNNYDYRNRAENLKRAKREILGRRKERLQVWLEKNIFFFKLGFKKKKVNKDQFGEFPPFYKGRKMGNPSIFRIYSRKLVCIFIWLLIRPLP